MESNAKEKFEFYVAGVKHHNLKYVMEEITEGEYLELVKEPTNKYDKNAIKILFYSTIHGSTEMLGYVPGRISADVTHFISRHPEGVICEVVKLIPDADPWNQLRVKIYYDKSYNEVELDDEDEEDSDA